MMSECERKQGDQAVELGPLQPGGKAPLPFVLVIFGASGDLTRRKLIPAVFNLYKQKLLPEAFSIIGYARRANSDEGFRDQMQRAIEEGYPDESLDGKVWEAFSRRLFYHQANLEDISGYESLKERLAQGGCGEDHGCNTLFYLATQPRYFVSVVDKLHQVGLNRYDRDQGHWSRIIVEKPFGIDLESAIELNRNLKKAFLEEQIFRIDHYMGKETVQNLLVLRFANALFEPIWNHRYVDHVQITVSESMGVGRRGAFYEQAGAVRDIVQNHMMHLISLVAMEPPFSLKPDVIRDEKLQVIRALRPIPPVCALNGIVRAQYTSGTLEGQAVCGYRDEEGVAADSITETYVAFKAMIDNWRWSGVPFYIRTGKRMPVRITEIGIHFKPVPKILFNARESMAPNCLTIRIQPNEGISIKFQVKQPGPAMVIEPYNMRFSYSGTFGHSPPDAYERLLLDSALGDATLFIRSDEVEAAWAFLDPVIKGCTRFDQPATYPAGTWGPKEADDLIEADGRKWYLTRMPRGK
ncbi:MAG: glucose-6-phosphate dehydrogenase [Sedimentisphaerales bacterium]|nr:glucose-6-phosphate dehydrogenase [Sedimentisphaerales bacterium]